MAGAGLCWSVLAIVLMALAAVRHTDGADEVLSGTEAEAARTAVQEALDAVALSAGKYLRENRDQLSLPPALYEETRRWASIVKVSVKHNFNNLTFSKLGTLRRAGDAGVDPLGGTGNASFTLPLVLDEPHLTGEFLFKLSGVGPSGNFDSTIGVYKLEAEGTAAVSRNACGVRFSKVRDIEIGTVDTQMHGATVFLNAPLAPLVTSDISNGKLGFQGRVNEAVLQALQDQASKLDCTPIVQRHIRKSPSTA